MSHCNFQQNWLDYDNKVYEDRFFSLWLLNVQIKYAKKALIIKALFDYNKKVQICFNDYWMFR